MNPNELHAVSLLLRGASKTLIVIDDNNPATVLLAECFVSLISSFHNTPAVIGNPHTTHPLISYIPTETYSTNFITTLKNAGNIVASQKEHTITLTSQKNPEISVQFPFDCLIILTDTPCTTSPFLLQNPHLLITIPSIIITNTPRCPYPATHTITSPTRATLANVVFNFFQKINLEITPHQATTLLAVLYQESNFLTQPLSPQTLTLASRLLELGAEHEKIMRALLRNKSPEELFMLGNVYTNLIINEKTGIAHTTVPFPHAVAETAARETFTSLRNIHLCVIPESVGPVNTYHIWSDGSISLPTILPVCEGDITKQYAKITINEDLESFIIYLQHRIESL